MPPKDRKPAPNADDSDDEAGAATPGEPAAPGRKPPGPGDRRISNLAPPASTDDADDADGALGDDGSTAADGDAPEEPGGAPDHGEDDDHGAAGDVGDDADAADGAGGDGRADRDGEDDDGPRDHDAGDDGAGDRDAGDRDGEDDDGEPTQPHAYDLSELTALEAERAAGGVDDATSAGGDGAPAPDDGEPEPGSEVASTGAPTSGAPVTAASGRGLRRAAVAAVLAIVLVVGVLQLRRADQLADQRDDRLAVERVASAFGAAYLSYDFEHAEVSAKAVHDLATEAFAKAYAAQSAPGIQELFSSRQTTTRASTQEVFVGEVRRGSARVLVVVDVTATSATEGTQKLDDVSFVLDLSRQAGGWRVAKVVRTPQPTIELITTSTSAPPLAEP